MEGTDQTPALELVNWVAGWGDWYCSPAWSPRGATERGPGTCPRTAVPSSEHTSLLPPFQALSTDNLPQSWGSTFWEAKGKRGTRVCNTGHSPCFPVPEKKQRRRSEYAPLSSGQSTKGTEMFLILFFAWKKPVIHKSDYSKKLFWNPKQARKY